VAANKPRHWYVPSQTRRAVVAVVLALLGLFLCLAPFSLAGVLGSGAYESIFGFLGWGYPIVPALCFLFSITMLREEPWGVAALKIVASALFFFSGLGSVDIVSGHGGWLGHAISALFISWLSVYAGGITLVALAGIAVLVLLEGRISLAVLTAIAAAPWHALRAIGRTFGRLFRKKQGDATAEDAGGETIALSASETDAAPAEAAPVAAPEAVGEVPPALPETPLRSTADTPEVPHEHQVPRRSAADELKALLGSYNAPPLSLLACDKGKASVGDIKASANIIKRTLQNFGIMVEMDEISVGPSVTRYAIKPAEGVRLQKIMALQQNLELALAAHPVRIEAPIPGKSLVGIEVPNSAKVTVGLGTMLAAPEFTNSDKPLLAALGRDIAGVSHFGNIAKMPHLLIAGATGSGKSVTIHTVITSLLYRNAPQTLRLILIDPKRVELTLYNRIPHLLSPVITDPKRAIAALRWAGKEMQRRYDILEQVRVRDIGSYHTNILKPALEKLRELKDRGEDAPEGKVPEGMPYIVIVIDELADIMQTFPRELEAAIVRLAQMSRAVGIHLILSTQRPSVNVITGLIKANVPGRIALQVASQIDSRTILDQAGAEKLLGAGDMLFLGSDSKPVRLQSAYIDEVEVKNVADYIAKHTEAEVPIDFGGPSAGAISISEGGPAFSSGGGGGHGGGGMGDFGSDDGFGGGDDEEVDDTMYEAAKSAVLEAGKASTSYIQRKLRVGYARAARMMDVLEERGVIGPADGAKPREILIGHESGGATPGASAAPTPAVPASQGLLHDDDLRI